MNNFRSHILVVVLLLSACYVSAQEHNFIKYNVQEGLPQSQVYDIIQDSKSYIWIATQGGGATRFDGSSFQTYTTRDGLPSNYVNTVYEDPNNHIWLGTKNGLCSFDHKKIDWNERSDLNVECITALNDSMLLIGSRSGLYSFNIRSKTSKRMRVDALLNIARINQFTWIKDELWIASSQGLYIKDSNTFKRIPFDELESNDIKSVTSDRKNNVWVSQFGVGVSLLDQTSKKVRTTLKDKKLSRVQHSLFDKLRTFNLVKLKNCGTGPEKPASLRLSCI